MMVLDTNEDVASESHSFFGEDLDLILDSHKILK